LGYGVGVFFGPNSPMSMTGNDTITAGNGNDWITGADGNNVISGGGGQDILVGSGKNDHIYANGQVDINTALDFANHGIATGKTGDLILGGDGNNTLVGGNGNDILSTGQGNSLLVGGPGNEFFIGGALTPSADLNPVFSVPSLLVSSRPQDGSHWSQWSITPQGNTWQLNEISGTNTDGSIAWNTGSDSMFGGSGNDTFLGGDGGNYIDGGSGNALIISGQGNDTIFGGNGNDTIYGQNGGDYIDGEGGNDFIAGGSGDNTIYGGSGRDTIFAGDDGSGWATSDNAGNNYVEAGSGNTVIYGSGGRDTLIGGAGNDTIYAGDGNAYLEGGGGNSSLVGGAGNDTLMAGDGNDTLIAGTGNATLYGGNGSDVLRASSGNAVLYAGDGGTMANPTRLFGGSGSDTLYGGYGCAILRGGSGTEVIYAGDGGTAEHPALVYAGTGNDTIYGGASDTQIDASAANQGDQLEAGDGDTTIIGGAGDDTIVVGSGTDFLDGRGGSNTYVINAGLGNTTITQNSGSETLRFGDGISLADLTATVVATNDGSQALEIDTAGGGTLTVVHGMSGAIGSLQFADGSALTLAQFLAQANTLGSAVRTSTGDYIFSGTPGDSLVGGAGNDTLSAWGAGDILTAGSGDNQLEAHGANSVLVGGTGNDTLSADGDNATLVAGPGTSSLMATGSNNAYVLTTGGHTTIEDSSKAGTNTLWLPSGMSLTDFLATRLGEDLVIISKSGDTQAIISGYFGAQSSGLQWLVDSSLDHAGSLDDWVAEQSTAIDYTGQINAARSVFSARLMAELNAEGKAGETLGTLQDVSQGKGYLYPGGEWTAVGRYTFDGVTVQAITASDASLVLGSSEAETANLVQQTHTVTYQVDVYQTIETPPQSYSTNIPAGVSGFNVPNNSSVTHVQTNNDGSNTYQIIEPGTYQSVFAGTRTVTQTVEELTVEVERGFVLQNVTGSSGDQTITANGVFVGSVKTGDGDNYVNLGTTSATQADWLLGMWANWLPFPSLASHGLGAFVEAGNGNNTLVGTDGNDVLVAGSGDDFLNGGRGADTYYAPLSGNSLTSINDTGNPGSNQDFLLYGGGFPLDTLVLPDGIRLQDLKIRVYDDPHQPGQHILQINHGDANVLVFFADPTGPNWTGISVESAIGIERFQFADGTILTRDQLIAQATLLPNDFNPTVTTQDETLQASQSVAIAVLMTTTDDGNNTVLRYQVSLDGSEGGILFLNGQAVAADKTVDITATQLPQLSYTAGVAEGTDALQIRAFDGAAWSPWSVAQLTTMAQSLGFVVTPAADLSADAFHSAAITDFFSATDQLSLPITEYQFQDQANGSGRLVLDGNLTDGTPVTVDAADLARVRYLAGQADDMDTIQVRAFDGENWSPWAVLDLVTPAATNILYGDDSQGQVQGGSGDQILVAGQGNTLVGGNDPDTFVLRQGSGQTTIVDSGKETGDIIEFGAGINADNVWYATSGADLVVHFGHQNGTDAVVIQNFQAGTAVGTPVISRFQYADGSYATVSENSQGDTTWQNYTAAGHLIDNTWKNADGSSGNDVFNTDGSSSGRIVNPDDSFSIYTNDGQGKVTTTVFDSSGNELGYSVAVTDSQGHITTTNYDANGNELGNGSTSNKTVNADGSYSVSANDGHGNVTTTHFASDGTKLNDTWTQADGSSGSDWFNADGSYGGHIVGANGSITDTWHNADGNSGSTTTQADGSTETDYFAASGAKTGDTWKRADGSAGNDWFNADGGSGSSWSKADGGSGNTWVNADGSYGSHSSGADGSRSDAWHSADGSYGLTAVQADGSGGNEWHSAQSDFSRTTMAAHGVVVQAESQYTDASGSHTNDLKNYRTDGSLQDETITTTSADGLTVSYARDTNGDWMIEQRETVVTDAAGNRIDDVQTLSFGNLTTEVASAIGSGQTAPDQIIQGGSSGHTLTGGAGNDFLVGGWGNDTIQAGAGNNVIAINRWHGQDTLLATAGASTTLSLGGVGTGDLSFQKSGDNLILNLGGGNLQTLADWYAAPSNQDVATLQVIGDGSNGQSKVQTFDFHILVQEFDQARAANSSLNNWSLMNGLLDAHLANSDTAALGGDLAYQYATTGDLGTVALAAAQNIIADAKFGSQAQALGSAQQLTPVGAHLA